MSGPESNGRRRIATPWDVALDEPVEDHCKVLGRPRRKSSKPPASPTVLRVLLWEHTIEVLPHNDCAGRLEK